MFLVFFLALLLRLSLAFSAYHGDLNNNISWASLAVERGLSGFYENPPAGGWPYSAPNQPPLTILMFAGARVIWQGIENASWWLNNNFEFFYSPFIWFWESQGMTLLVKLPGILADLGIGWLIYKYFSEKKKKLALPLAATWLFNPISWYNSSIWGQTDSLVNFLGLAAIFSLLSKNMTWFMVLFSLSLLFKGSLAIFVPVLFVVAILQRHSLWQWAKSAAASFATIVLVSIWFHPSANLVAWLINLYKDRILPGEIGYLTANAFNLWWLVDPGRTLDSTAFLGLPARAWGFAITFAGIGGIILWLSRRKRQGILEKRVLLALALVGLFTFLFMTRIHERYLYPFFPSATILLGLIPGMIIPYVILSITHLLNLYHLFWAPPLAPLEALYQFPAFAQTISVINILVFFYLLRLLRPGKI